MRTCYKHRHLEKGSIYCNECVEEESFWNKVNEEINAGNKLVTVCEPSATVVMPDGIEAMVCTEIATRQAKGVQKYGTTVADNPLSLREWLQHALEECLDQAIYLRRAIAEIDAKEGK